MLADPKTLKENNISALKTNSYSIDEIIKDANEWFEELIVPVSKHSRGYKIACKKLADEVISLRVKLKELQSCKSKPEKLSASPSLAAAVSAS